MAAAKLPYLFINQRHYTNLKFIVLVYNKFQIRITQADITRNCSLLLLCSFSLNVYRYRYITLCIFKSSFRNINFKNMLTGLYCAQCNNAGVNHIARTPVTESLPCTICFRITAINTVTLGIVLPERFAGYPARFIAEL